MIKDYINNQILLIKGKKSLFEFSYGYCFLLQLPYWFLALFLCELSVILLR